MRRGLSWVVVLVVAALVLPIAPALAAPVEATPEEKAAAVVRPAMVYLEQYFSAYVKVPGVGFLQNGQPFEWATRCSGFVVNPNGYIVTAGHCVDLGAEGAKHAAVVQAVQWLIQQGGIPASDAESYIDTGLRNWGVEGEAKGSPTDRKVYVQRGVAAGGVKTGAAKPARVLDVNPPSKGDVALLKIEEENLPILQIAPKSTIQIGTEVLAVGYPGSTDEVTDASLEPDFKDGKISSKKTREGGLLPVYEMSAALSGGMSGGPTVDLQGRVVGVNSFNIVGETESFNFISPSSLISETLTQKNVDNTLSAVDKLYREGLNLYWAGDGKAALVKFNAVLDRVPTHQGASDFKIKATEVAATQKSSPIMLIVIIAAAVLVLGGGGFGFARSRKSKQPAVAMAGGPSPIAATPTFGTPATPSYGTPETPSYPAAQPAAEPVTPPAPATRIEPVTPPAPAAPPVGFQTPAAASEQQPAPVGFQPPAPAPEPAQPAATESAERFCSSCGQKVEAGARFCGKCGRAM